MKGSMKGGWERRLGKAVGKGGWERDLGANHGDETPFFKDVNGLLGEHRPSRSVIGKENDGQSPCRGTEACR